MKTFNEFISEDGAVAAGSGAAPTNTTAGIAPSEKDPPMFRKKQKSYQAKNAAAQVNYVNNGMASMRKTLGGVNV